MKTNCSNNRVCHDGLTSNAGMAWSVVNFAINAVEKGSILNLKYP